MSRLQGTKLLTICFIWSLMNLGYGELQCKNGGTVVENSCTCPPDFTGTDCGTEIYTEQQKKKLQIEECFVEESLTSIASGSGSGSGSGEDPATESGEIVCQDPEKRPIDGSCEFVNTFEGSFSIPTTAKVSDFEDESSPGYEKLSKQSQCLLKIIFQDLGLVGFEVTKLTDDDGNVVVDYVIKVARDVTSENLETALALAQAVASHMIGGAVVRDINECDDNLHTCDDKTANCENTDGSYNCRCWLNHTDATQDGGRPGSKCRHVCNDEEGNDFCMSGGSCSITTDGRGVCECPINYAGERCETEWHIFVNATVGLAAALGIVLIIFVIVTLMICARNRVKSSSKSNFVELESNSANGEFTANTDVNEIKGISNPYMSPDEGITVATKVDADSDGPAVEDDQL